jgi:hypothetical protein
MTYNLMMNSHDLPTVHHPHHERPMQVKVLGCQVSDFSRHLVEEIASEALLHIVHITSVRRTVEDQARIFYNKHVLEGKNARYKNPEVAKIVAHARDLHAKGRPEWIVKKYLISSIEQVHGGPSSISRHLGSYPFSEVFDVAHYSGPTSGSGRHNYMSHTQARAFLEACRGRMSYPITRLGHSAELGFKRPNEFHDEKCFHMEVLQPVFDKLEFSTTKLA